PPRHRPGIPQTGQAAPGGVVPRARRGPIVSARVPACCRCDPDTCRSDDSGDHCITAGCAYCLNGCPATDRPCCKEPQMPDQEPIRPEQIPDRLVELYRNAFTGRATPAPATPEQATRAGLAAVLTEVVEEIARAVET